MKKSLSLAFFTAFLSISPLSAQSGIPLELSYQATVTDDAGALIAPTTPVNYEITVRIWDAPTGGNLLWSEKQSAPVLKGRFSIVLGQGAPVLIPGGQEPRPALDTVFGESTRYTEVTLKSLADAGAAPTTFSPRQKLVATATALRAKVAETLVDSSITESAIPAQSLSGNILLNNTITSREIAGQTIVGSNIANNTITAGQLGTNSVGSSELADNAVDAGAIASGAVSNAKLASNAVTSAKILNGTITGADIATGTIESADIKDSTITGNDIASGTITASDIATGGVAGNDIADNTITFGKLGSGVGTPHMSTSTNTKLLYSGGSSSSSVIVPVKASDYGLPTSGVDGLILKVFIISNDAANDGTALIFWGSNYAFPPTSGTIPYLCNSVVTSGGIGTAGTGQVFCPLKSNGSGNYEFRIRSYRRDSWNSSTSVVVIGVIGYY